MFAWEERKTNQLIKKGTTDVWSQRVRSPFELIH
jgi:hypothetical protein